MYQKLFHCENYFSCGRSFSFVLTAIGSKAVGKEALLHTRTNPNITTQTQIHTHGNHAYVHASVLDVFSIKRFSILHTPFIILESFHYPKYNNTKQNTIITVAYATSAAKTNRKKSKTKQKRKSIVSFQIVKRVF